MFHRLKLKFASVLMLALASILNTEAQLPSPSATPLFPQLQPLNQTPPPQQSQPLQPGVQTPPPEPARDIPLLEKKWEELSNHEIGDYGKVALAIKPDRWKHAESENFIFHFRRYTEARKVVREIEYDLWFVAVALGATKDQYSSKSHVFIFEDQAEWDSFIAKVNRPAWVQSYAQLDELFLNVRQNNGILDSHTLAHETTHAVVARLYKPELYGRWPIWLNEGFAEYMGGASVAARTHQLPASKMRNLGNALIPLDDLAATKKYPDDPIKVAEFYQSSEKFVRFLMTKSPKERFLKFIDAVIGGKSMEDAVMEIYGDQYKDFDTFKKKYEVFTK